MSDRIPRDAFADVTVSIQADGMKAPITRWLGTTLDRAEDIARRIAFEMVEQISPPPTPEELAAHVKDHVATDHLTEIMDVVDHRVPGQGGSR